MEEYIFYFKAKIKARNIQVAWKKALDHIKNQHYKTMKINEVICPPRRKKK